jgi:hypothetical protein
MRIKAVMPGIHEVEPGRLNLSLSRVTLMTHHLNTRVGEAQSAKRCPSAST